MKMKKKILASLLAVCLFVGMAVPAFAEEKLPEDKTSTAKTLGVPPANATDGEKPTITIAELTGELKKSTKCKEDENGQITGFDGTGIASIKVTLKAGTKAYDKVRFTSNNENLGDGIQLIAKDSSNNYFNVLKAGWGQPVGGFKLDANYEQTTDVFVVVNEYGSYTGSINLVDLSNSTEIASVSTTITLDAPATVADVENYDDYKKALEDPNITVINITKPLTATASEGGDLVVRIPERTGTENKLTINGKGNALNFGIHAGSVSELIVDGVILNVNEKSLSATGQNAQVAAIQTSNTTNLTIKNSTINLDLSDVSSTDIKRVCIAFGGAELTATNNTFITGTNVANTRSNYGIYYVAGNATDLNITSNHFKGIKGKHFDIGTEGVLDDLQPIGKNDWSTDAVNIYANPSTAIATDDFGTASSSFRQSTTSLAVWARDLVSKGASVLIDNTTSANAPYKGELYKKGASSYWSKHADTKVDYTGTSVDWKAIATIPAQQLGTRPATGPNGANADYNYKATYDLFVKSFSNGVIKVDEAAVTNAANAAKLAEIVNDPEAYYGVSYIVPAGATKVQKNNNAAIGLDKASTNAGFDVMIVDGKPVVIQYYPIATLDGTAWKSVDDYTRNTVLTWTVPDKDQTTKEVKALATVSKTSYVKPPVVPTPPAPPQNPSNNTGATGGGTGGGTSTGSGSNSDPVVTPPASGTSGTTDVVYDSVSPTENIVQGDKTISVSEITMDTAVTDAATASNPVAIKTGLSTTDTVSSITNAATPTVEVKLVVPNAVMTNANVKIAEIKVDAAVFEAAKASGKDVTFTVETASGVEVASWTFNGAQITNAISADLAVNLMTAPTTLVAAANKPLVVSFNHSGALPSEAKVTLNVDGKYSNGEKLFLYYNNSAMNKLELVSTNNTVANGKVTIAINHCSDYVLTKTAITTKAPTTPTTKPPQTGDTAPIYAVVVLAVMAGALVIGKKKLFNN